jgi:hypothetical protein
MKSARALHLLSALALLGAFGGCEKSGDALLVIGVTSNDPALGAVRTFEVKVTTRVGARRTDTLTFEVPDGGALTVSSMPIRMEVLILADYGAVDVEVSALEGTTMLASGKSRNPILLSRGSRIPVDVELTHADLPTDGGTADGSSDAGDTGVPAVVGNPQRARWPMPNNQKDVAAGAPNPATLVDNKNGTVTDMVTGLIWQQRWAPGIPGAPTEVLTQIQAADYCQSLILGGYQDWRVPTLIELVSIVDDSTSNPSTYPSFAATPPVVFWSATPTAGVPANAWAVTFSNGEFLASQMSNAHHIRCVRSGPRDPVTPYTFSVGTVTDHETQLVWQQSSATPKTREDANTQCKTRGPGWRLPTKNELLSLVDSSRSGPAADPLAQLDTPGEGYYQTATRSTETNGWVVDFATGQPKTFSDIPHPFRCVGSP